MVVPERWVWTGGWDGVWIARLGVRAVCNLVTQMSEINWDTPELTRYCCLQQGCGLDPKNLSIRSL